MSSHTIMTPWLLTLVCCCFMGCVRATRHPTSEVKDYCETETFEPACPDDNVILMTSSRYGRMRIGSCVKKDLGYIGCSADVLSVLDSRCSGRQSCAVRIPDPELDSTRPCLEELKTYLEASYQCIPVDKPFVKCESDSPWTISRSTRSGYISSSVARDTRCATELHPVRISAWPGQRLNITAYDFSYVLGSIQGTGGGAAGMAGGAGSGVMEGVEGALTGRALTGRSGSSSLLTSGVEEGEKVEGKGGTATISGRPIPGAVLHLDQDCSQFAMIFDPDTRRKVKICPGSRRIRNIYISSNMSIELYFKRVGGALLLDDDQRLLIQFTVLDCAHIRPVDDMWVSQVSGGGGGGGKEGAGEGGETEVEIGCRWTDQKWRLTCVDNRWEGFVGNCTKSSPLGVTINTDYDTTLSHGAAIAIVLCVALLMGIIILVLGALGLLLRKFQNKLSGRGDIIFHADIIKTTSGHRRHRHGGPVGAGEYGTTSAQSGGGEGEEDGGSTTDDQGRGVPCRFSDDNKYSECLRCNCAGVPANHRTLPYSSSTFHQSGSPYLSPCGVLARRGGPGVHQNNYAPIRTSPRNISNVASLPSAFRHGNSAGGRAGSGGSGQLAVYAKTVDENQGEGGLVIPAASVQPGGVVDGGITWMDRPEVSNTAVDEHIQELVERRLKMAANGCFLRATVGVAGGGFTEGCGEGGCYTQGLEGEGAADTPCTCPLKGVDVGLSRDLNGTFAFWKSQRKLTQKTEYTPVWDSIQYGQVLEHA